MIDGIGSDAFADERLALGETRALLVEMASQFPPDATRESNDVDCAVRLDTETTELGFVVVLKSIAGGSAQMSAPEGSPHTRKDRLR